MNRTILQVFLTYLTGALCVHPLWFYKHQHDNRVRSKLFVACQRWWFQWRFWFPAPFPLTRQRIFKPAITTAMDLARDRWWSDATRLATSFSRCNPMWFLSMGLRQGSGLCSSSSRKYPGTEGTNQKHHWNHHRWHATLYSIILNYCSLNIRAKSKNSNLRFSTAYSFTSMLQLNFTLFKRLGFFSIWCTATSWPSSFIISAHSISEHDEENITNLKVVLLSKP